MSTLTPPTVTVRQWTPTRNLYTCVNCYRVPLNAEGLRELGYFAMAHHLIFEHGMDEFAAERLVTNSSFAAWRARKKDKADAVAP